MADVATYVAQIRAAIYGEQVRESIAKSIEAMNDDNIETLANYNDTIEAVEAATDAANDAADAANDAATAAETTASAAASEATATASAAASAAETTASNAASDAAAAVNAKIAEVQTKLDNGDFIGATGPAGTAATVQIGTVNTGLPGSAAQVTNSGTSTAAVLNFTIPQGATGNMENLDTAAVTFTIDSSEQNIASGMTVAGLFSRIQKLFDKLIITTAEITALGTKIGDSAVSRLHGVIDGIEDIVMTMYSEGKIPLDTTAASGDDYELYAAITALSWQSDVIEDEDES